MREMLEAGVHFGHQSRYWNPKMAPYLYGQRNKIHIINLEKTLPMFNDAINFAGRLAANRGTILFVGTKRAAQKIIEEEATRCNMPYVNRRWLGGLLTNFKTVKQSINRLKELESMAEEGLLERLSKKELLHHQRELDKLERSLSGIRNMSSIPDALFVVDVGYEYIAVNEAKKLGLPVIGVVDSNNDPEKVDYVIPGNDDAIRSIQLYASGIADAVLDAGQSLAHLGVAGEGDEFVELDESGAPVAAAREGARKSRTVIKKVSLKKDISREQGEAEPEPAAVETEVVSEAVPAVEAATEPEAAPEAVVAAEVTAETASEGPEGPAGEETAPAAAVEEKAAQPEESKAAEPETKTRKKTKKKTTAKKKVTKKKTTRKTKKKTTAKKSAARAEDS